MEIYSKKIATVLMPREFEILNLVFEGLSFTQISRKLNITDDEVKKYYKQLLKKFEARNSVELVRKALEDSWLKL